MQLRRAFLQLEADYKAVTSQEKEEVGWVGAGELPAISRQQQLVSSRCLCVGGWVLWSVG